MDCKMAIRAAEVDPVGLKILITEGKGRRECEIGRIQELSDKDTF